MAVQTFKLIRAEEDPGTAPIQLTVLDEYDPANWRGPISVILYDEDGEAALAQVSSYKVEHIQGLGGKVMLELFFTGTEVTR